MSPDKETRYRYLFICTQVSERKLIRMVPRFIPVPIQLSIGTGFYISKNNSMMGKVDTVFNQSDSGPVQA